ncbi:MAG: hybrid sensor histidine kinase/response regulator [Bdellovibrionaceae bacterium]|nr:hybrid sensor histidine kinase/response regulator [Pseudobdellovibrionaceae bacterium]
MKTIAETSHISIDWIAKKASVWAFIATIFFVTIFSLIALLQEVRARIDKEERRLAVVAPAITRSIASELLVGDERSLELLSEELKRQFNLSSLELVKNENVCTLRSDTWRKWIPTFESCLAVPLKEISASLFLVVRSRTPELSLATGFSVVFWFCVPLILFGLFTTYRIRKELEKSIVEPIKRLARDPENWDGGTQPWVAEETVTLYKKLQSYMRERDLEKDKALTLQTQASIGDMAAQVAHDIRSPLAALDMLATGLTQLPEEKRVLMRGALGRIRDIANGLLDKHRTHPTDTAAETEIKAELISSLVEPLLSEKRVQYRGKLEIQIDSVVGPRSYGLFAKVNSTEFKRVLSNIIDNGVEALGKKGKVVVETFADKEAVTICVVDNGKGISAENLPRLMTRGETFGKSSGAGLGLYHAKRSVEAWGGSIRIQSQEGKGTTVQIDLPRVAIPNWFFSQLVLKPRTTVVILDDDPSIHHVWEGRFQSLKLRERSVQICHFSTGEDASRWFENPKNASPGDVYLIDYELVGESKNGLQLIAEHSIAANSVLVTSRSDEKAVRARCQKLGVPLLPKNLAAFVPILLEGSSPV